MVPLLQAQPSSYLRGSGRLGSYATEKHPAQATRPPGTWGRERPSALAERLFCQAWVVLLGHGPCDGLSILSQVNHRPESRMRETCLYGSEGGGTDQRFSLPLSGGEGGGASLDPRFRDCRFSPCRCSRGPRGRCSRRTRAGTSPAATPSPRRHPSCARPFVISPPFFDSLFRGNDEGRAIALLGPRSTDTLPTKSEVSRKRRSPHSCPRQPESGACVTVGRACRLHRARQCPPLCCTCFVLIISASAGGRWAMRRNAEGVAHLTEQIATARPGASA